MITPCTFPDPKTRDPFGRRIQRFLELVPGSLTWTIILGMPLLSFVAPVAAAIMVIVFDIYWIYLTVYVAIFSGIAYWKLRVGKRTDWKGRLADLADLDRAIAEREAEAARVATRVPGERRSLRDRLGARRRRSELRRYVGELRRLRERRDEIMNPEDVVHAILFPTANEGPEIIEPAIRSVVEGDYPLSKVIVILATEEREPKERREQKAEYLRERFRGVFREFLVTTHHVEPGEMKCKASNAGFAARELMRYLDRENISYDRVIFSNFDCDSVVHLAYFSALTYAYVTDPDRLRRAYQPLPMYHNNLWDTNAFVRVMVTGSSFWHMYQSTKATMVTFSSHSEPFDTLVRVNFWPVNMISEDSVIYWKGVACFHGDYRVNVIPLPISLDAVLAPTYLGTLRNEYRQKRRWAYGIENFPVTMRAIWPDRIIPLYRKLAITVEMLEGHVSWATAPLIIAFLGWLPLLLGGTTFNESVLAHNLPDVTRLLMNLALLGLVIFVFLSFLMLPPRPAKYGPWRTFLMFAQWFLAPLIALLGAIPAIDAQTRLLLGKYFGEFWVTEKMRK